MEELKESLFIRISHPWEKVKPLIERWTQHFSAAAVYQHDADEETNRTHCHMVLTGLNVGRKRLRQIAEQMSFPIKGNENCSIVEYDGSETPYVYMAKGSLDPVYLKGFTQENADKWKASWTVPNHREPKLPKLEEIYNDFVQDSHKQKTNWNILKDEAWRLIKRYRKVCDATFFQYYKAIVLTYISDYGHLSNPELRVPRNDNWWAKGLPESMLEYPYPQAVITLDV